MLSLKILKILLLLINVTMTFLLAGWFETIVQMRFNANGELCVNVFNEVNELFMLYDC
jgi:hypothetical protein